MTGSLGGFLIRSWKSLVLMKNGGTGLIYAAGLQASLSWLMENQQAFLTPREV